jgi:hypothetical protein
MQPVPLVKPGDDITADAYNTLAAAFNALVLSVAPGSDLALVDGVLMSTAKVWRWLKLTSGSGTGASRVYAWTVVERDGVGGWTDTGWSGTTSDYPARKANGTASIATFPYYVRAIFEVEGPIFMASDC